MPPRAEQQVHTATWGEESAYTENFRAVTKPRALQSPSVDTFLSLPAVISDPLATERLAEAQLQLSTHSLGATAEEEQNSAPG